MLVLSRQVSEAVIIGDEHRLIVRSIGATEATFLLESREGFHPIGSPTSMVKTMQCNEEWTLSADVVLTLVDVRHGPPDKVRLGIELPREMPVHRQEVREAISHDMHHWWDDLARE
jgi:carbon storage regulator